MKKERGVNKKEAKSVVDFGTIRLTSSVVDDVRRNFYKEVDGVIDCSNFCFKMEGKAKIIYDSVSCGEFLIQKFKDDITAFNRKKHDLIKGKGFVNNNISCFIFRMLAKFGIKNHFLAKIDDVHQLVWRADSIPLEVVIRNKPEGGMVRKFGVTKNLTFMEPVIEFCLKDDNLDDPVVGEGHILSMGILKRHEIDEIKDISLKVNYCLSSLFYAVNIELVDFKMEFGFFDIKNRGIGGLEKKKDIILIDEISPDSCRLVDMRTGRVLDKDRYRKNLDKNLEDVLNSYMVVAKRLNII